MSKSIFSGFVIFILGALWLLSGSQAAFSQTAAAVTAPSAQSPVGTFAILPFVKGDFTENFRTKNLSPLVCPIDQVCVDLSEGDETLMFMERLDKHLQKIMRKKYDGNLLPAEKVKNQYDMLALDSSKDTTLSVALRVAEKVQSDYILVPILWSYSERKGSQFSAKEPASISISLFLVSAKEGKRVWKDQYNKTQQSLTENLLNAKELVKFGGKWVTAEELAQAGLHQLVNNISY